MNAKEYFTTRDELLSILKESQNTMLYDPAIPGLINMLYLKLSSDSVIYYKTIEKAKGLFDRMRSDLVEIRKKTGGSIYHRDFVSAIKEINLTCNLENPRQFLDYNSENYYSKQIKEWKDKAAKLNKEIEELKQSNEKYEEKEKELETIKGKIDRIQIEKDELLRKIDAQNNIQNKISEAFSELKKHISPLEKEKTRLNWMFGVYAFLCVCVLGILVYFEFSYLSKWEGAEKWIDYLPFYIPVPIVGGLLWAFIYQMNRAQRQLIQVANVLYHIDYVEGLLLAINLVSVDVSSASEKISNVLDSLIKNYMSIPDSLSEQSLDMEISKDNLNLHTFINLAKEVKDVIK